MKCSEQRLFLFRSGQGGREYNVYLPDSSLFHIYDEVHQGSACGHPKTQEIVGREKNLRKELSNSIPHPRFPSCNRWWGSRIPVHPLCEETHQTHSGIQQSLIFCVLVTIWVHDSFFEKLLTLSQCSLYTPRRFCETTVGGFFWEVERGWKEKELGRKVGTYRRLNL